MITILLIHVQNHKAAGGFFEVGFTTGKPWSLDSAILGFCYFYLESHT
jgi:hypothetical protein